MKSAKSFLRGRRWLMMFGAFFFVWSVASAREQRLVLEGLLALTLAGIAAMMATHCKKRAAIRENGRTNRGDQIVVAAVRWVAFVVLAAAGLAVAVKIPSEVYGGVLVGVILCLSASTFADSKMTVKIVLATSLAVFTVLFVGYVEFLGGLGLLSFVGVVVGCAVVLVVQLKIADI